MTESSAQLLSRELLWRDRQKFLQAHGYMLRPRYIAGWIPSWKSYQEVYEAEDHVRGPDGKLVMLKRVPADSQELRVCSRLTSQELRNDPRNHCVPVLDVFTDAQDPGMAYIIMPFLRHIDDPGFDTVGSILTCVDELLRGLVFLHEKHVAHRDCTYMNIMMDATAMYPQGFHPTAPHVLPTQVTTAPVVPRSRVHVIYYYVGFSISTCSSPDDTTKLFTGTKGLDRQVPEPSNKDPYDPFKGDIFMLGNMFRTSILQLQKTHLTKYSNVDSLLPLVEKMLSQTPAERPSANEALKQFRDISRKIWPVHSMWRAHLRDESMMGTAVYDIW
ncbi:kinase-like domain-containing protein [Fomes fomentarius]|nr:kinase-like domain-containing protein [Fomes fomentarius]